METVTVISALGRTPAQGKISQSIEHIEKTAENFEALVIAQLLQPLFASVETPGIAGGGNGQKAFEALLQEQYTNAFAERGGFGIADQVKKSLIEMQAQSQATLSSKEQ